MSEARVLTEASTDPAKLAGHIDGAGDDPVAKATAPPTLVEALRATEQFLRRYVVFARPETVVAVVLWIAHTYAMERAEATPYLAISSPEKQSGKTRLLECLTVLASGAAGILITPTASTIYRSLEATPEATLLIDELDAIFKDRSDKYEEVRAVINAGHRRGATVPRNVQGPRNSWTVKQFPVFGPKALAGIGKLPDTVADRAIPVRMLKRKRSEPIERFRHRTARLEGAAIAEALAQALSGQPPATEADVPIELPDRAAEAWEPLLAIADTAGGTWPKRARRVASILNASRERDDSLGLRLLADIRVAFTTSNVERISTVDLIAMLKADDEGPWADDRSPLTAHRLARLLLPYEIESRQMRIGAANCKGYARESFVDTWERYLPSASGAEEAQHRNIDHEQSFDVSDPGPSDGPSASLLADLSVEEDYPESAWGLHPDDDPGHDTWFEMAFAEPTGDRSP